MIRNTLLALSLVSLTFAQDAKTKDAVAAADKAWGAAMAKGDQAALGKLLADDLNYIHSTGAIDSKTTLMGKMKSGEQKYLKLDHEGMEVRLYGSTAVVTATGFVQTEAKGKAAPANHLRWIHVWYLHKGTWVLVAHQSLRI